MLNSFPRIKVCGITRPNDAKHAANLGVDYLGLIFYKESPRKVTQKLARTIIAATPPTVQFVLVFVNEPVESVIATARKLQCAVVQLHGSYSAKEIVTIQRSGLKVIRAFQIGSGSDVKSAFSSRADFVLLDNKKQGAKSIYGGTGQTFDWTLLKDKTTCPKNLVLAGGLTVENFESALQFTDPLILDFNSGVESAPGVKSLTKLKKLFAAVEKWRQNHAN